jgi:hypothetical protein
MLCTRDYIDGYNECDEQEDEVPDYGTEIRVLRASPTVSNRHQGLEITCCLMSLIA